MRAYVMLLLAGCGVMDESTGEVDEAVSAHISAPLRDYRGWSKWDQDQFERHAARPLPDSSSNATDTAVQDTATATATIAGNFFEGVAIGEATGLKWHPPDTVGAIGPNHYVQAVNDGLGVFDRYGNQILIVPVNAVWHGLGGGCETNNDGDPTVNYDVLADRWIIAQFSVSTTPYLECVAVSTTGDPTGTYYQYAFAQNNGFPDYPKLSVWPSAYIETFNLFTSKFVGGEVCAYDRAAMLAGEPVAEKCHLLGSKYGGVLPSHVTSATQAPAADAPAYLLNLGRTGLDVWTYDFASDTLSTPRLVPIAGYSTPKKGAAQPGTSKRLDTLGDRVMYRLQYRNFGDHESLVVNHSVATAGGLGVRWYELRGTGGAPSVYQQGTYAPDSDSRWMGSIAMDKQGNIAVGYSASSSSTYPSIRYAARLATDPLGTLGAETHAVDGIASQTTTNRWGDYSSMSVDPLDDCTFWYTTEYMVNSNDWHTSIGHFKLASCP